MSSRKKPRQNVQKQTQKVNDGWTVVGAKKNSAAHAEKKKMKKAEEARKREEKQQKKERFALIAAAAAAEEEKKIKPHLLASSNNNNGHHGGGGGGGKTKKKKKNFTTILDLSEEASKKESAKKHKAAEKKANKQKAAAAAALAASNSGSFSLSLSSSLTFDGESSSSAPSSPSTSSSSSSSSSSTSTYSSSLPRKDPSLLSSVSLDRLGIFLAKVIVRYPIDYDAQLKTVAENFTRSFSAVSASKLSLLDLSNYIQSTKILCKTIDNLPQIFEDWLGGMPKDEKLSFFWFVVNQITVSGIQSQKETIPISRLGLYVMISLFTKHCSWAVVNDLQTLSSWKVNDKLKNVDVPVFLWIFGQMLTYDSKSALKAWFEVLFPLLCTSSAQQAHRDATIVFIRHLLKNCTPELTEADAPWCIKGVKQVLVTRYSLSSQMLAESLGTIYSLLKTNIVVGQQQEMFFPVYLRLTTSENRKLRAEVLDSLCRMLATNPNCFQILINLYRTHIAQTNNLIFFILQKWDKENYEIPADKLSQTVHDILTINKSLTQNSLQTADTQTQKKLAMCTVACRALERRLSSNFWNAILLIFIFIAGLAIFFAILCNKQDKRCEEVVGMVESEVARIRLVLEEEWPWSGKD